jgi:hypothetical protein
MFDYLTAARDKLAAIPGVKTCKIGIEPTLNPDDYPMIRLVASRMAPIPNTGNSRRRLDMVVYFGAAIYETVDGVEAVLAELFRMEAAIIEAVRFGAGCVVRHVETLTDEDRLEHFKLFAARFEVEG